MYQTIADRHCDIYKNTLSNMNYYDMRYGNIEKKKKEKKNKAEPTIMLFIFNKNDKHRKACFNSISFLLKIVSFSPLIALHLSNAIIFVWLLFFLMIFFSYFLNMFANLIFGTNSVPGCVYRVHVLTLILDCIQVKQIVCIQTLWAINHVFWVRAVFYDSMHSCLFVCLFM